MNAKKSPLTDLEMNCALRFLACERMPFPLSCYPRQIQNFVSRRLRERNKKITPSRSK
jgi:hypothetical protein